MVLVEKFHHYRKLSSLEEYGLVAQYLQRVECYRRADAPGLARLPTACTAHFETIDLELPLAEIYEGNAFAEPASNEYLQI